MNDKINRVLEMFYARRYAVREHKEFANIEGTVVLVA